MKINVIQHCDEAMEDALVVQFVTDVFKAAEGKTGAAHCRQRVPCGDVWIELRVGRSVSECSALLVDCLGTLGVWRRTRCAFYPDGAMARAFRLF